MVAATLSHFCCLAFSRPRTNAIMAFRRSPKPSSSDLFGIGRAPARPAWPYGKDEGSGRQSSGQ